MNEPLPLKRIAAWSALVLATLMVLFVVFRSGEVVLLFVLSIIVAAALRKGILWLEMHRVPRSLAILLCYVLMLGTLAGAVFTMGPFFRADLTHASNTLPLFYDNLLGRWKAGGVDWQQAIANRLPTTATVFQNVGSSPSDVGFQLAGFTTGVLNIAISLVAILTLTFYWLADQERFERIWLTLLPVQQRSVARTTWRSIETQVGAYVRSEAAQFILTLFVLWGSLSAMGVPYATVIALYGSFAQLLPWIGIPLTLLALAPLALTVSPGLLVAAAGIIIASGVLMDQVVEPYLSRGANAHPILVVVALLVMADAAGLPGMLVALPLAATFQIVVSAVVRSNASARDTSANQEAAQIQALRTRIEQLQRELPADSEQLRVLEGLTMRLDSLIERAENLVRERAIATEQHRFRLRRRSQRVAVFDQRN